MNIRSKVFIVLNTVAVGGCYMVYNIRQEKYNQMLYKNTTVFKEAMSVLKSHKGAVHYLGDFIEDGRLQVLEEKKDGDDTIYHVKVAVRGTDGQGNMFFWVSRKDDDAQLNRIELKLVNMTKRLLVLDRNKTQKAGDEPVKT